MALQYTQLGPVYTQPFNNHQPLRVLLFKDIYLHFYIRTVNSILEFGFFGSMAKLGGIPKDTLEQVARNLI